jgi:hypothetical protein
VTWTARTGTGGRRGTIVRGRVIHVRDKNSGRSAVVASPRRIVDAELVTAGLFYAYNTRGGRVRFVPLAELRRMLAR